MTVDDVRIKFTVYNAEGDVVQSDLAEAGVHLDNSTMTFICTSNPNQAGADVQMKYRIDRKIKVNGVVKNVRAQTEQEYAEKVVKLFCPDWKPESESDAGREKHGFAAYAWNWFEIYSKPNVETVTANSYRQQINRYLLPAFGELCLEDITTDDVQRLFNGMKTTKASKNKLRIVLNQILDAAVEDGIIPKSPLRSNRVRINGAASVETSPYSVEQMQYLVSHIGSLKQPQDRFFIALMALHPLRLEEALGLKWEDVDFEHGTFCIRRAVTHPVRNQPEIKDTKTEKSKRTLALSKIASEYLQTETNREGFILGGENPLSYTQVHRMCERIQRETGFGERITPIRFRTTVLTDIYDQTKDLRLTQDSGGHATPTMTLKHYVKGRAGESRSAEAIDSLYAG